MQNLVIYPKVRNEERRDKLNRKKTSVKYRTKQDCKRNYNYLESWHSQTMKRCDYQNFAQYPDDKQFLWAVESFDRKLFKYLKAYGAGKIAKKVSDRDKHQIKEQLSFQRKLNPVSRMVNILQRVNNRCLLYSLTDQGWRKQPISEDQLDDREDFCEEDFLSIMHGNKEVKEMQLTCASIASSSLSEVPESSDDETQSGEQRSVPASISTGFNDFRGQKTEKNIESTLQKIFRRQAKLHSRKYSRYCYKKGLQCQKLFKNREKNLSYRGDKWFKYYDLPLSELSKKFLKMQNHMDWNVHLLKINKRRTKHHSNYHPDGKR